LNPRGTCAPIRFRVGRLQPGSATPPRNLFKMLHDFTPVGTRRIGRDARRPLRDDPVGCARTASRGPGSDSPPTPARSWGPPRPSPDHWQPCADRNAKLLHRGERRPSLSPAARQTPAAPHPGRISTHREAGPGRRWWTGRADVNANRRHIPDQAPAPATASERRRRDQVSVSVPGPRAAFLPPLAAPRRNSPSGLIRLVRLDA
jgi:hypothetical protein